MARRTVAAAIERLLELLARGPGAWIDVEILFGRLPLAGWRTWPAGEIAAVERYLAALWRTVLSSYPAHLDVATVLRAYSQLLDDLQPCLAAWDVDDRIAALRHLAALILDNWGRAVAHG